MNEKGGGREVFVGERLKSKVENCFHFVMAKKHTGGGRICRLAAAFIFQRELAECRTCTQKNLRDVSHIFSVVIFPLQFLTTLLEIQFL